MLETYLLEQLAAFAEYGTLSDAARQLNLSQSALSRSMQKMENIIGVPLFSRKRNHIALNENGKIAAEYAKQMLREQRDMIEKVRAFDRKRRTISLGCCAPVPQNEVMKLLSEHFTDFSISAELNSDSSLLSGLKNDFFQLVVLHEKPTDEALYIKPCGSERLFISLPPAHPLSKRQGIRLGDLDGEHILLYAKIGFWYELCVKKMPRAKFLMQHEREVFKELADVSALPSFTTDVLIHHGYAQKNRIHVPILDVEANVTYYIVCQKEQQARFQQFFDALAKLGDWGLSPIEYVL
ncbi:MAG: LysR family transcriptional regulator [Selenomonadaceae bacterium]|nr:LysR family transcriptional regulator [Selenomonadaceae bacterium]